MRKVEFWDWITREDVQNNPDKIFLFGDNLERTGLGGQAREMRGEPNAIGIVTKKYPHSLDSAFFWSDLDWTDLTVDLTQYRVDRDFAKIPDNVTVVVPSAGLGTGLARLDRTCPEMLAYIEQKIKEL